MAGPAWCWVSPKHCLLHNQAEVGVPALEWLRNGRSHGGENQGGVDGRRGVRYRGKSRYGLQHFELK